MAFTKQQTVSGNNDGSASTTVFATLVASQSGSLLIAAICCAVANATITPPAGWIQIGSTQPTNPVGGSVALFKYESNPGGITTVTFTFTSSLAAIVISEYLGAPSALSLDNSSGSANVNGTAVTSGNITAKEYTELQVWAIGLIATTAPTLSAISAGFSTDGSNISTSASGNAVIFLLSNLGSLNSLLNASCTLSTTPTDGPSNILASFISFLYKLNDGGVGPIALLQGVPA